MQKITAMVSQCTVAMAVVFVIESIWMDYEITTGRSVQF